MGEQVEQDALAVAPASLVVVVLVGPAVAQVLPAAAVVAVPVVTVELSAAPDSKGETAELVAEQVLAAVVVSAVPVAQVVAVGL